MPVRQPPPSPPQPDTRVVVVQPASAYLHLRTRLSLSMAAALAVRARWRISRGALAAKGSFYRARVASCLTVSAPLAQAFPALRRLQDLWTHASLGLPPGTSEAWILGERFGALPPPPEATPDPPHHPPPSATHDAPPAADPLPGVAAAWGRLLRCTYRRGGAPFPGGLASDAGWGCTLRSGQALLANALARRLGLLCGGNAPDSPPDASSHDASHNTATDALLRCFADDGVAPFGVAALLRAGCGAGLDLKPGSWVGPSQVCSALAAAAAAPGSPLAFSHNQLGGCGLRVLVAARCGGGAPTLFKEDVVAACAATDGETDGEEGDAPMQTHSDASVGALPSSPSPLPFPPPPVPGWTPCLLLVPLVLGLGRTLHTPYIPQICAALRLRASAGVVGGRPGASLLLVGAAVAASTSADAPHAPPAAGAGAAADAATTTTATVGSLGAAAGGCVALYLDPHEVQPAALWDGDGASEPRKAEDAPETAAAAASTADDAAAVAVTSVRDDDAAPSAAAAAGDAAHEPLSPSPPVPHPSPPLPTPTPSAVIPPSLSRLRSFSAPLLRHMPLSGLDPSLALAFYVASPAELDELLDGLEAMAAAHSGAPLLLVARSGTAAGAEGEDARAAAATEAGLDCDEEEEEAGEEEAEGGAEGAGGAQDEKEEAEEEEGERAGRAGGEGDAGGGGAAGTLPGEGASEIAGGARHAAEESGRAAGEPTPPARAEAADARGGARADVTPPLSHEGAAAGAAGDGDAAPMSSASLSTEAEA